MLRIRLLGELEIRWDDAPALSLESGRAESLLAYLLLHRSAPQPRQRLAFLLWPDSTEAQARTNLRHVLHNLRHALPDPDQFLHATTRTLQWRADAQVWLDVAEFESLAKAATGEAPEDAIANWRRAVALYRGDLLEACYDEWITDERARLRHECIRALESIVPLLGNNADAITYAEMLLRRDPLHEETYRLLMHLHDVRGDRARALRVYYECAATLERELGIVPELRTRDAYAALLPTADAFVDPVVSEPRGSLHAGIIRPTERAHLAALWRNAESGTSQFVLLTGEAGVGKTWLVEELRSACARAGAVTAAAHSYPAEGTLAYAPVVAWLRAEPFAARIAHLDGARHEELARLLPELRTRRPENVSSYAAYDDEQRERLFEAVTRVLVAPGSPPILLIADDVQWCDRETLQVIHYLIRAKPRAGLLIAATARREEVDADHPLNELIAGLHALECVSEMEVGRLTADETTELAERFTGLPLPGSAADELFRDTEGNALFVVETMRAGWKPGQTDRRTSAKVQAVIQSRLARLSEPARELAGVAATIGREFTADVLGRASGADEEVLVRALDELWRRRIIRDQAADAYDFTHDRIREAAYLALSPARRRRHHLQVAQALEDLQAGQLEGMSGHVAAHYERAGATEQAVAWYARAAEAAQHLHANADAERLLERALALVRLLPETPARAAQELSILTSFAVLLGWVEGFASPRVADAQRRALELSRALHVPVAPSLLRSTAMFSLSREQFEDAERAGAELRARGAADGDDILIVEGEYMLGVAAFWKAQFDAAREHLEAAIDRCQPGHVRAHLQRYGQDPRVICLSRLGNTLWFLGHPDEATHARDAALSLVGETAHPHSRATALVFAAMLALELPGREKLREYVAALAQPQGAQSTKPAFIASQALAGFIDVLDGRATHGVSRIRGALEEAEQGHHAPGNRSCIERILVAALSEANDPRAGLAVADHALQRRAGIRVFEAELRRARAEFLAALGEPDEEVEAELGRALVTARSQNAHGFELRIEASRLQLVKAAER